MPDIFISYGRRESKHFATRLHDKLMADGYDVWFDQNDIPLGVDFQEQIDEGIMTSNNFVFLIAPHAIASPYCLKEIQLAIKYNKRIIPILHVDSDFDTMHPTIQKLNWIYAREKADTTKPQQEWEAIESFDKAYVSLVSVVENEDDYVHEHTRLLLKALAWEKEQKKTAFLLVGEERKKAEKWLLIKEFTETITENGKTRVQKTQAPCRPSDLHAEFICESRKNAENLLSDVFISHAQPEKDLRNQIVRTLAQYNITCWSPQTDVKSGQDWNKAVEEGIEQTDNFVFFITPYTVANDFFRRCLRHANNYNKRIIPLLVLPTPFADFPDEIRSLTYIDITDNQSTEDLRTDLANLLNEINTDAMYYYQHKVLLVQALRWKKQNQNPSILLRGYNLQAAEDWLKIGKLRDNHKPHLYHEEYIHESVAKRGQLATEVFISYSRNDADFARKLNSELQLYGKTTWFDQESIVEGVDFGEEIRKGIESSDNFVFLISPKAVSSVYCTDEVNWAVKLGKRIITVLVEPLPIPADSTSHEPILHPALAKVQWIDIRKDFNTAFGQLLRALENDREHIQQHTKWGQKATAWLDNDRNPDLLLRGSEFALADDWLRKSVELDSKGHQKSPQPTEFQLEYIQASKRAIVTERVEKVNTIRRLRFLLAAAAIALIAAVGSTIYAFRQRNEAHEKALSAEINQLAALARQVQATNPALALRIAERAYLKQDFPSVRNVIRDILSDNIFYINLDNLAAVNAVVVSPDNKFIVTGNDNNVIDIWDKHGKKLNSLPLHEKAITSLDFSPKGDYFLSGSADGTVKFWDTDGVLFGNIDLGKDLAVTHVNIANDGTKILICNRDTIAPTEADKIKVYNPQGTKITEIEGHVGGTLVAKFSQSSRYIASAGMDSIAKIYDSKGRELRKLNGHDGVIYALDISPDETLVATGGADYFAKIWELQTGKERATLRGHSGTIKTLAFSPDGKTLATAGTDKTIKIWNQKGENISTFNIHYNTVTSLHFSENGYYLCSASLDNTATIIDLRGNGIITYKEPNLLVKGAMFLPTTTKENSKTTQNDKQVEDARIATSNILSNNLGDAIGEEIITYNANGNLTFWDKNGKPTSSSEVISDIDCWQFSPNKKMLLVSDLHNEIDILDTKGNKIRGFETPSTEYTLSSVIFSPDSKFVAAANFARTIRIWSIESSEIKFIRLHDDGWAACMAFMPDGKSLILGGTDNIIRQIDLDGKVLREWKGHDGQIYCLAVSPDGKQILSGSGDNTAKLWNVYSKDVQTLKGHSRPITSVCFANNGMRILTASSDGKARLYESYQSNEYLGYEKRALLNHDKSVMYESQVYSHDYPVTSICFSDDDKTVLTVANNEAKLWYADWTEFLSADRVARFSLAELAQAGVNVEFEEFIKQTKAKDLVEAAEYYTGEYESNEKLRQEAKLVFAKQLFEKGLAILQDTTKQNAITQNTLISFNNTYDEFNTKLISRAKIGLAEIQASVGEAISMQNFTKAQNSKEILSYIAFFDNKLSKAHNKVDSTAYQKNLTLMYNLLITKLESTEDLLRYAEKFENHGDDSPVPQEVMRNHEMAVRIYEKLYKITKQDDIKLKIANLCVSVASLKLFDKEFREAIIFSQRAVTLDNSRLDSYAILATAYLYDNQLDKAKKIYEKYRKVSYRGMQLQDLFVGNLQALQSQGIVCADFEKALEILK